MHEISTVYTWNYWHKSKYIVKNSQKLFKKLYKNSSKIVVTIYHNFRPCHCSCGATFEQILCTRWPAYQICAIVYMNFNSNITGVGLSISLGLHSIYLNKIKIFYVPGCLAVKVWLSYCFFFSSYSISPNGSFNVTSTS